MGLVILNISFYMTRSIQRAQALSSDESHISHDLLERVEWRMGRHGQRKGIYNGVDNDGTIFVRESFSQTFSNVPGFLDANPFRPHRLSNLGEIWILELHARRDDAGLLLFDMDEVVLLVVENDLNHGNPSFYLRQQIAHSQHREASIAA